MYSLQSIKSFVFPPFQLSEAEENEIDILDPIRERIVTALLRICMIFGIPAVLLGTIPTYQEGSLWELVSAYLGLALVTVLAVKRTISYKKRSFFIVLGAFLYMLASHVDGINELTFALLFSFVVMVTLISGTRESLFAVGISVLMIMLAGLLLNNQIIIFREDLIAAQNDLLLSLAFYATWLFFIGIFVFTAWVYFDGFYILLDRERKARQAMQKERDLLIHSLAREKHLIEELELSYQQVSELSALKSKMITAVSHEFRTPLTVIKSSSELLAYHLDRLKPEKRQAIQLRINDSINSINQLLQNIEYIDLGNRHDTEVKKETVTIQALQDLIVHETKNSFPETQINYSLITEAADSINSDVELIIRILSHLLSNAIKFSDKESEITIQFELHYDLFITVQDEGIGIKTLDLSRLWEPFYKADEVHHFPGLGIGLTIAKFLAESIEGKITAVSPGENQGSSFVLCLPMKSTQTK